MNQDIPANQDEFGQRQNISNIFVEHSQNITFNQTQIIQISADAIKTKSLIETSPYKGLKRFEAGDKERFFGRDQFLRELANELEQTNLLLLLGASGSGKSSVVRAGLIPWLSKQHGSRFVDFAFTPDQDPFESLYACLLSKYKQSEVQIAREAHTDTLTQVVTTLRKAGDFWFILIDQFEELFTTSQANKSGCFIGSIVQLNNALKIIGSPKDCPVKLIATMRSDFLDRLDAYPDLVKVTDRYRPLIAAMQPDELRQAIEQPAAHHGVVLETGLVEEIIKDIQGQAGYLPLLQYTLNFLWEEELRSGRMNDRTLNSRIYYELGGVRGALQKHVEQIYASLSEPKQLATQHIFLKLVEIGGDVESGTEWKPIRRRTLRTEFSHELEQQVLSQLINENLLVSDRQLRSQESTIEIAHEVLLTSWERLNLWIEENRQAIAFRNQLNDDVGRWKAKKQEDELWSGSKLQQSLNLRQDPTFKEVLGGFSLDANQFLDASIGKRNRQQHRTIFGIAALSTIALALTGLAGWQWQQSERQRVEQLVQKARSIVPKNPREALIQSIAAVGLSRSPLVSFPNRPVPTSIHDILWKTSVDNYEQNLLLHEDTVDEVTFSPDGKFILSESSNELYLWDSQGDVVKKFPDGQPRLQEIAFTPDHQLVSINADGAVELRDTEGNLIKQLFKDESLSPGVQIAISANKRRIIVGDLDGAMRLYDDQGNVLRVFPKANKSVVTFLAISSDGRLIASKGEFDDGLLLWDEDGKRLEVPLQGDKSKIQVIAFSPEGKFMAAGNSDGTLTLWDLKGNLVKSFEGKQDASVSFIAFSLDGQVLTTGDESGTVRLWNVAEGVPSSPPLRGHQGIITSVALSPDGQSVISSSTDRTVRLWKDNQIPNVGIGISEDPVSVVSVSPNGQHLLTGHKSGTLRIWNIESLALERDIEIEKNVFGAHEQSITAIAVSPNSKQIVTGDSTGTLRLWNEQGEPIGRSFKGHDGSIFAVTFSLISQSFATSGKDGLIRFWDLQGNRIGQTKKSCENQIDFIAFSPKEEQVISTCEDSRALHFWDLSCCAFKLHPQHFLYF